VIVVWSDYVSPYAFVAKAGAYALEADYEVELQRRPYTLDVAFLHGPGGRARSHHWRRVRYSYMDARRFTNKQGLVLKGPKKVYYARSANAGMLYAQSHGVFRRYNDLAFDRLWAARTRSGKCRCRGRAERLPRVELGIGIGSSLPRFTKADADASGRATSRDP